MELLYHIVLLPISRQSVSAYLCDKARTMPHQAYYVLEHLILSIIRGCTSRYSGMPPQGGPHYPQKV